MTRHHAGLALGCLALRPAVSSFREPLRRCGPASVPPRARDRRTRGPRGSILFLLALLATAGLPPRPALAGPQAPTAATCRERYHVFFSPPLRLPQASSGTWGTAADEPGAVQCSGTFNGIDITGDGTSTITGTYGTLLTGLAGGDSCVLSQLKVSTIAFDLTNATAHHVHFDLTGTVLRLGPPGVVFGHDKVTGVPVTAEVTSQTDQSCSGAVSSVHASLVRALGVGLPPGVFPGD
jgi:hypothetical protein